MNEQYYSGEDWYEEEGDQTQRHQAQRDEIVGVGYVEPEYGYYCGMCKVQKRVAVLMSKEDLVRHGTSNKGLGHRMTDSMVERFVGCAILEDRRVAGRATGRDLEQIAPTLTASPSTSVAANEAIHIAPNPEAEHISSNDDVQAAAAAAPADPPKTLPPGNMIKQSRPKSKRRGPSPSQDFHLDRNDSDDDCEELSALEIDQFSHKFPITPPMASPNFFQQGTLRVAGPAAGMATPRGTRTRAATESVTTRKRGVTWTDPEEAGAGEDGKTTRQPNKVRNKKEIFEVQMTGVTIKTQRNHMVGDKRIFESLCNSFQTEAEHPTKTRPSSNRKHRSMTASSPAPPTNSGTPESFAGGFDSGFTFRPVAGAGVFEDEPADLFDSSDSTTFHEFGDLFGDEEMDFFSRSVFNS